MTTNTPTPETAAPLLTENDMLGRITSLLAPAVLPDRLWMLLLDGQHYQTPVMMPVDECPPLPDVAMLDALTEVARGIIAEGTDRAGSVIFVRERLGGHRPDADDHAWAAGLTGACERASVKLAGIFLLTPQRVQPLAP